MSDKKPTGSLVSAILGPKEDEEMEEPAEVPDVAEAAAQEAMDAFKAGDVKALAAAFRSLMDGGSPEE